MTFEQARGWLSAAEAETLASLADGKTVLEVGSFCGRSALAMASTAKRVYCVDHFRGDEGSSGGVRDECFANIDAADIWDKVVVLVGSQEVVVPKLNLQDIDVVFYDASHDYDSTANGIQLLIDAGLGQDTTLVFHDYLESTPGVMQFVDQFAATTGRQPTIVDSMAIFPGLSRPAVHDVMLAVPHNGTICYGTAQAIFRASFVHNVQVNNSQSSALAAVFNNLFVDALNLVERGEITHLAFLHSDIAPQDGWIDMLLGEMDRLGADMVSAVSPIKDERGLTSTAIGVPGAVWSPLRRLTMTEVMNLPETFSVEDTGYTGHELLVNSGCWVADLRNPLFRELDEKGELKAFFTLNDRIINLNDTWRYQFESEDWFFSRRLAQMGAKVYATRKVKLKHFGDYGFPSDHAWGAWEEDEQTRAFRENWGM